MVAAIPPMPNRGPRSSWRCPSRDGNGHRCSLRQFHSGPCRAFKAEWWGVPKGRRRAAKRIQPVLAP